MVPAKLKRHFTTKHENLTSKGKDYFDRLLITKNKQTTYFNKTMKLSIKSQIASYKIAELVVMKQKPHTIAESLILPLQDHQYYVWRRSKKRNYENTSLK